MEEPAALQLTMPSGDANDSYAVDIGISAKWEVSPAWSLGPLVEYHRNTETDSEQDNFQAGLTGTYLLGDVTEGSAHFFQAKAAYKDDNVGVGSGELGKIEYYFLKPDWAIGSDRGPAAWRFRWQPMIGVQYDSGDDVAKSKRSGHTGRGTASLMIRMLPFASSFDCAIEFTLTEKYWSSFSVSAAYDELVPAEEYLFKASLNYFFDEDKNVALGLDYTNGGDPEKGRIDQEEAVLTFKFQFGGQRE